MEIAYFQPGEPGRRIDGFTMAVEGGQTWVVAAYVRALDLSVDRLEQHYLRLPDDGPQRRYDYAAPGFDVRCSRVYDESGLVLEYPGIAVRVI
jgi:hypothetical protein